MLLPVAAVFAGVVAYAFRRRILAKLLGLPPPRNQVAVEQQLTIPMSDGAELMADHYAPQAVRCSLRHHVPLSGIHEAARAY